MIEFPWSAYSHRPFQSDARNQTRLDIGGTRRVNSLPWRGQFSPELVEFLLEEIDRAGLLVDPFCGSGTTLVEAARSGRPSQGSEVNPAAYLLSRVYETILLGADERHAVTRALTESVASVERSGPTLDDVANWANAADSRSEKILRDASLLLAVGNGTELEPGKLTIAANQLRQLVLSLPITEASVAVRLEDARRLSIPEGAAAGLITSPPYINVFNYHQNYRPVVEALGWEVLGSARAEFGSNRKHRQNRFLTVIQYAQDIARTIQESGRVLQHGAVAVWVVGRESRVLSVPIPNPLIVFEVATRGLGLELIRKYERSFTSRFGQRVYEDVLVFRHAKYHQAVASVDTTILGREVALDVLNTALQHAGPAYDAMHAAIRAADSVTPSIPPTFKLGGMTISSGQVPAESALLTKA